jgi:hypothetical protein
MISLVVGALDDPHVRAVVQASERRPAVLDVQTLRQSSFEFHPPSIRIRRPEWTLEVTPETPGWLRRLAPMAWEAGTTIGSHDAVTKASWLALLASLLRHPDIRWLSGVDSMTAAENKLSQYTTAARLGLIVPETHVTNLRTTFDRLDDDDFVAKPLGPGHFQHEDGSWLTVFTERFDTTDPEDLELLEGPPFLVQQRLHAASHLRVTTVNDRAWVFRLASEGLPIDWRQAEHAHHSWTHVADDGIGAMAVKLARAHGLGYSSQDWIETDDEVVFLDLNPGGQWLFLPTPAAHEITTSIAEWLDEPWD